MSTTTISEITSDRAALIRQAFRLEYITLAWMTIEAAVAIGSGVSANSLTLTAFAAPFGQMQLRASRAAGSPSSSWVQWSRNFSSVAGGRTR